MLLKYEPSARKHMSHGTTYNLAGEKLTLPCYAIWYVIGPGNQLVNTYQTEEQAEASLTEYDHTYGVGRYEVKRFYGAGQTIPPPNGTFICPLCGQRIDDGKPCRCGA